MFIIVSLCFIFSMFLINDNNSINKEYFDIVKSSNNTITIYRNNKKVSLSSLDYLIGVVGCEIDASYHEEAIKAQAVVANTYALRSNKINRQLTDDTNTQCFKDNIQLKEKWKDNYDIYYKKISSSVNEVLDEAIYYDDELIDALYYSVSNGYTEDAYNVWGNDISYLVSVDSSWDKLDKNYKNVISKDLNSFLNILGVNNSNYRILSRDNSNRVLEVMVGNKVFSGVSFRKLLGLKSTDFEIEIVNDKVNITTYGYGHGVGMSQAGANYLANNGYNYKDIIKYYYKGVDIY